MGPHVAAVTDDSSVVFPESSASPITTTDLPLVIVDALPAHEWDSFVERHPSGSVETLSGWREIFERVFAQRTMYLAARRGSEVVGVLPLVLFRSALFGRAVVSLPYANYAGVVTSDPQAMRALIERAEDIGRGFGAAYVELRHITALTASLPRRSHKVGVQLPLPATAELLWASLDRKVRNQIRKAQKEGLVVEQGGLELIHEFYDVFSANMRDLGTPVFPQELFREVVKTFPSAARVFVVRAGSTPIAGGIGLAWRDATLVPWASSLREYRNLCANMLLYWSLLEWSISRGCRVFDFGRSTPEGGTHHFKRQWGAREFPLHWEYVLLSRSEPPDHGTTSPKVQRLIEIWKRLPLWLANALGPAVVRHVS